MRKQISVLLLLFTAFIASAQSPDPLIREGQRIAAELRTSAPTEETNIRGVLEIRSKKAKISEDVPVIFSVLVANGHWDAVYETGQTSTRGSERLVVRHFEDRPNQYFYAKAPAPTAAVPELKEFISHEADIPLAGSDFWLTDLGMDFLHWPLHRRPRGEMRLGQWCHVLESIYPERPNINKVVSWIDRDSADVGVAGILIAEAYAPGGKQLKEFSLSGSSFKKIKGQWQLEKMTIRNLRTSSTTTLRFDLKSPQSAGATVSSAGN
ncbi:MAG: outer membrane lipoprotein-sorting protein [Verrucomicrobia bacterium]|nr:outer membrane lipoprotein-sorting protein [Verrucomicrobiota bacterium]